MEYPAARSRRDHIHSVSDLVGHVDILRRRLRADQNGFDLRHLFS